MAKDSKTGIESLYCDRGAQYEVPGEATLDLALGIITKVSNMAANVIEFTKKATNVKGLRRRQNG